MNLMETDNSQSTEQMVERVNKIPYTAPVLEMIDVKVEKGYQASDSTLGDRDEEEM